MKNGLFKKSMSVFLSILMLMSCWVWIAPTQAEAATTGSVNPSALTAIYDGSENRGDSSKIVICSDGGAGNTTVGHIKFEAGNVCCITKGHNRGRVGTIVRRDRHFGSFDIVHVRDAAGHEFATRLANVFVIGEGDEPVVSLPKGNGVKLSIIEEKKAREHRA